MAHVKDIAITKGKIYRGGCHCRGVRFCLTGPLRQPLICYCRDCFQIASLSWGSTSVLDDSFELTAQQTLGWYDSSAWAKRGFCRNCGASLFYRLNGIVRTSVAIGMLGDANDLAIAGQIFADSLPHWDRLRPDDLPHLIISLGVKSPKISQPRDVGGMAMAMQGRPAANSAAQAARA